MLGELERRGLADLAALWRAADLSDDFAAWIIDAYPELAAQYATLAADLGAEWYEESAPHLAYKAKAAPLPPLEQFAASASWALNTGAGSTALDLLGGSMQRSVLDGYRETIVLNADTEGATWARHASANACPFCRMLATRGDVYASKESATRVGGRGKAIAPTAPGKMGRKAGGVRTRGKQSLGDRYHDNCHCIAVEVRPGDTYEPPPYVAKWADEYDEASMIARDVPRTKTTRKGTKVDMTGAGAGSTADIQRIMREGVGSRTRDEWLKLLAK